MIPPFTLPISEIFDFVNREDERDRSQSSFAQMWALKGLPLRRAPHIYIIYIYYIYKHKFCLFIYILKVYIQLLIEEP